MPRLLSLDPSWTCRRLRLLILLNQAPLLPPGPEEGFRGRCQKAFTLQDIQALLDLADTLTLTTLIEGRPWGSEGETMPTQRDLTLTSHRVQCGLPPAPGLPLVMKMAWSDPRVVDTNPLQVRSP